MRQRVAGARHPAKAVATALAVLLAGAATVPTAALAAPTTTTSDGVTAVGSAYGWASFLFFLVVVGGGVWLWRRRVG